MFGNPGYGERSGEIYLPYVGHITENVILLRDGSVMAMGYVKGVPFELEDTVVRNGRKRNMNTVLRNISDDNVTITTHMVRHSDVPGLPKTHFRSDFASRLHEDYNRRVLKDRLFRNDYFLSVVVTPRNALGKMGSKLFRVGKGEATEASDATVRQLEDVWQIVSSALDNYSVRRLGLREHDDVVFTEIGEALRLIISARWMPVPVVSGHLGASIYTDRVICGKRGFEVRSLDRSYVGGIFSFREYPAKTRPGMLNALLSVGFPLVVSQSFGFLTRSQADEKLTLKGNQMVSAGDKATSQIDQLTDAVDKLISNEFVFGSHHLSLAVYADTLAQLGDNAARARARLIVQGVLVMRGDLDARRGISRIIRVTLVSAFILEAGIYNGYVVNLFQTVLPTWAASSVSSSTASTPKLLDDIWNSLVNYSATIDKQLHWFQVVDLIELAMIAIADGAMLTIAFAIYICSSLMTAVILSLGPFVIAGFLFDATRNISERWIGKLVGLALLSLLVDVTMIIVATGIRTYMLACNLNAVSAAGTPGIAIQIMEQTAMFIAVSTFILISLPAAAAFIGGGVSLNPAGAILNTIIGGATGGVGTVAKAGANIGRKSSNK